MAYLGFDVLEVEPNWRDGREDGYKREWFRLDPGVGKVQVDDQAGLAITEQDFSWFMGDRAAIAAFKAFLAARKGAAVPFWFPTWRKDLQLYADALSGATTVNIVSIGFTKYVFPNPARRFVAIILQDGTKLYRRITDSTDPGNGLYETITIDSAPGVALPAATTMLCYLPLCRLAEDKVSVTWQSATAAEADLSFVEIPEEVP